MVDHLIHVMYKQMIKAFYFFFFWTEGPLATPYKFTMVPDNTTLTLREFDELGYITMATTEFVGDRALMTYMRDINDNYNLFLTANRTLDPFNYNHMVEIAHHVPSSTKLISHFYRFH